MPDTKEQAETIDNAVANDVIDAEVIEKPTETVAKSGGKAALFVALIALVAVAVMAWFGWQAWQKISQLESRNATLQLESQRQSDQLFAVSGRTELVDNLLADQRQLAALGNDTSSQVSQLNSRVQQVEGRATQAERIAADLAAKLGTNSRRAWLEGEAEYLLRFANQRLQLHADHNSAARALKAADERLVVLDDPRFFAAREAIADELGELSQAYRPDIVGMALGLSGAIDQVADLPLYNEGPSSFSRATAELSDDAAEQEETPVRSLKTFAQDIWSQFKGMVVVKRDESSYEPILTADQTTNLYGNLELKLEAARVALLRGDEQLFSQSLAVADEWLASWFDVESDKVVTLRQRLDILKEQSLSPELPDISGSLSIVIDLIDARDRAVSDAP